MFNTDSFFAKSNTNNYTSFSLENGLASNVQNIQEQKIGSGSYKIGFILGRLASWLIDKLL